MQRRSFIVHLGMPLVALAGAPSRARDGDSQAASDQTWHDGARARDLPVRLRWPSGTAPCGLIVHSHGLGGSREGGDAWGRAWQRAGFAVLHLQHPGSDTETLRSGLRALRRAASAEQLIARVTDMRFLLDEVERRVRAAAAPWSRVRLDALGASGHSFGAQTVLALAGKRFPVRTPAFVEPRFRAFVAFSPALGQGDERSPVQQFGAVERPLLVLTGSHDGSPLDPGLSGADRARVYEGLPAGQGRRALLWLDGADHMTFGGNAAQPLAARRGLRRREPQAVEREAGHQALIAERTTAWWQAQLLGDRAARAVLRSPQGLGPGDRWRMD